MNSINRTDNQHTIHAILARKYRSMILFVAVLLCGLWLSLSAYVLNNLYKESLDRMYSWVVAHKSRLEEGLFLKNVDSLEFRYSQWATFQDGFSFSQMALYDPDRKAILGDLPFPQEKEGLGYSVAGLGIHYFDSLYFAGNRVGYLYLKSQFKPIIFIAILVFIFAVCMGMFLAVRRMLTSFMHTLEQRIVAPIESLRDSMNRFDMVGQQTNMRLPQDSDPAIEIKELYEGYNSLLTRIREYSELEVKKAEADAEFRIAAQVAHDIRSPLAALRTAASSLTHVPDDSRNLIRLAVDRINDIANNLIATNKALVQTSSPTQNEHLLVLIDEIVTEKRAEYSTTSSPKIEFDLQEAAYPLFATLDGKEFKRVLSNLINNAKEAVLGTRPGLIQLTLSAKNSGIELCITDNGKGIPAEIIPQLTKRGFSFDKPNGTGLGLHHARTTIENWGGSLSIESELSQGTTLRIFLPRANSPHWFLAEIPVAKGSFFVIVDDDPSIHQLWRSRFGNLAQAGNTFKLFHLYTPSELRNWYKENPKQEALFLVDFEFTGHTTSGLELIESLNLMRSAVLVTGRYNDHEVRSECNRLDVRLLPKPLAALVPFAVRG